ncbi:stage V sporulation protein AB [[Clostridium] colinum]|uniref:stage V sporulation protein AB n=1 Tax=[Clostridium] colinum TaxID=36835 RepID=UPI002024C4F5|nr:stage V sporulation protein AB [[Clostridium] colinum]
MEAIKGILAIIIAFSSGIIISGAVFAFIAIIGVVPRLAQKTRTEDKIRIYEEAIIWGGIIGTVSMLYDFYIPIGKFFAMIYAGCIGIFFGCLAVSLAEILNVLPILTRRGRIQTGLKYFITAVALGKLIGSIIYSQIPSFYYM